jgi:hypothetical protein
MTPSIECKIESMVDRIHKIVVKITEREKVLKGKFVSYSLSEREWSHPKIHYLRDEKIAKYYQMTLSKTCCMDDINLCAYVIWVVASLLEAGVDGPA